SGRHADQRTNPELSAAPASHVADADLDWAVAGAQVARVHRDSGPEHSVDHRLMFALSDTRISAWVGQFLLPLFRIAALPRSMPVMLLMSIWTGPWLVRKLMEYTETLVHNIPLIIG